MENASLKKVLINQLVMATRVEALAKNEITLVTAAGIISGSLTQFKRNADAKSEPIKDEEPVADGFKLIHEPTEDRKAIVGNLADVAAQYYLEDLKIPEGQRLPGNDGFICLHDVKVKDSIGKTTNFVELIVFFDQIIAVTLVGKE